MTTTRMSSAVHHRNQCVSCAYPLNVDSDIFSVLSRVKGMMSHVGYTVDRLLVEESRDSIGSKSVTLLLRPSFLSKRAHPPSPDGSLDPASKRVAVPGCKLCPSSCCSTNSLCKANVCGHHGEEESAPVPSSPGPHRHFHGRKHNHSHPSGTSHANAVSEPRTHKHRHQGQRIQPLLIVPSAEPAAPPMSLPRDRDFGRSGVFPERRPLAQFDVTVHEGGHGLSKQRTPESNSQPEVPEPQQCERPTSFTQSRSTPGDGAAEYQPMPSEHAQEKESGSRWIAATARASASLDPVCAARLNEVDFAEGSTATASVAPSRKQPAIARGTLLLRRSSPTSRVLSSEANCALESDGGYQEEARKSREQTSACAPSTKRVCTEAQRSPPALECQPCRLNFSTELDLRRHQFVEHKDGKICKRTSEGRFMCLMHSCNQSFVRRHVMERHFKSVHLLVREFPCQSCDKSFADSSTRAAHRSAVHEKRKPYICDQCSSRFTQSSSLGKHRRRFHQETVLPRARSGR